MTNLFPTQKPQSKIPYGLLIIISIIICGVIVAVWQLRIEPFYGLIAPSMNTINAKASDFANLLRGLSPTVTNYISQKPETLITIGMGAITLVGIPLIKNYFEKQKAQAQMEAQQAITSQLETGKAYQELQKKYEDLLKAPKTEIALPDFSDKLQEAENLVQTQAQQIRDKDGTIKSLQAIIENMTQKTVVKTEVK